MQIIQNNFNYLKINNIEEFNFYFKENNLDPLSIKQKILNEIMWKQLIYNKFNEKIVINEKQIEKNISSKKIQREYLLSEILVAADEKVDLEKKFELINQIIKEKNFSIAALNYSISDTSKNGGKLGWIKENALNQIIKKQLSFKKIGEITNPISLPGGFLILKIEDIKETEKKLDLNKEIKNIIEKQKNEQLNMYSNIYFNKLKKNVKINEF
jgi:peptidyl-prolyl cis-trans isomerase SurA